MARPTREDRVGAAYGPLTTRVPQPRHPAGYASAFISRAAPNVYRTSRSAGPGPGTMAKRLAVRSRAMSASMRFLTSSLFSAGFRLFNWPSRMAKVRYLAKVAAGSNSIETFWANAPAVASKARRRILMLPKLSQTDVTWPGAVCSTGHDRERARMARRAGPGEPAQTRAQSKGSAPLECPGDGSGQFFALGFGQEKDQRAARCEEHRRERQRTADAENVRQSADRKWRESAGGASHVVTQALRRGSDRGGKQLGQHGAEHAEIAVPEEPDQRSHQHERGLMPSPLAVDRSQNRGAQHERQKHGPPAEAVRQEAE